jgi:hypothetical protein
VPVAVEVLPVEVRRQRGDCATEGPKLNATNAAVSAS